MVAFAVALRKLCSTLSISRWPRLFKWWIALSTGKITIQWRNSRGFYGVGLSNRKRFIPWTYSINHLFNIWAEVTSGYWRHTDINTAGRTPRWTSPTSLRPERECPCKMPKCAVPQKPAELRVPASSACWPVFLLPTLPTRQPMSRIKLNCILQLSSL